MLYELSYRFCVFVTHRMLRYAFHSPIHYSDDFFATCLLLAQLAPKRYCTNLKGVAVTLATATFDHITMGTGKFPNKNTFRIVQ